MQSEGGRQYVLVALGRTSQVAIAELQPRATKLAAADFLRRVLAKLPYRVPTVLTRGNEIQFGNGRHQPWDHTPGQVPAQLSGARAAVLYPT